MSYQNLFHVFEVSFAVADAPKVLISDIQREVARFHGITVDQLVHGGRSQKLCIPRHEAWWLTKKLLPHISYPLIGRHFGNRDHHTVIHGIRKIDHYINRRQVEGDDVIVLLQKFPSVAWH